MADWTVNEALDAIIASIKDGASLAFNHDTIDGLRRRYYPSVERNHGDPNRNWYDAKPYVLRLARLVGNLATVLTTMRSVKFENDLTAIDERSAYLAGYLVAQYICPNPGVWCDLYTLELKDGKLFEP